MSWVATTYLGAVQNRATSVIAWSRPVFDAYIAGAWLLFWTDDTLYWVAKPTVRTEPANGRKRLHWETGPAVDSDVEPLYFWHGVMVPPHWIEDRTNLTPKEVLKTMNTEQRAAGVSIIGMRRMLDALPHKIIDSSSDPQRGDLIEVTLPGLPETEFYLKFFCPRNGEMLEGVNKRQLAKPDLHHAHAWHAGIPARLYSQPTSRS